MLDQICQSLMGTNDISLVLSRQAILIWLNSKQLDAKRSFHYTLTQVFCHKQSLVYLQFYQNCIGKIVNKQRIVCDRIPGSRYKNIK